MEAPKCIHCDRTLANGHGAFARCAGGKTQFEAAPALPDVAEGEKESFYQRLDRKELEGRNERLFRNRPENLHDYQGCANDPNMQPTGAGEQRGLKYQEADNGMHSANFGTHIKEAVAIVKDWAGEQRGDTPHPAEELRQQLKDGGMLALDGTDEAQEAQPLPARPNQHNSKPTWILYANRLEAELSRLTSPTEFIGSLRRRLFMPYDCKWNGYVRDITAELEKDEQVPVEVAYRRIFKDFSDAMTAGELIATLTSKEEQGGWIDGGVSLIAAERRRQIEKEGWTPEHDDEHLMGEMIGAAMTYAGHALEIVSDHELPTADETEYWPWDMEWWKPSPDPIRNLVKAGALIGAEIDRLKRLPTPPDSRKER